METRRTRRIAIAVVATVHLMLLLALRSAMVSEPPPDETPGVLVELYFAQVDDVPPPPEPSDEAGRDAPASDAAPSEPASTPPVAGPPVTPQDRPAMAARFVESTAPADAEIDTKRLFEPDGSVRLSQEIHDAAAATKEPDFKTPPLEQPEFMTRKSPVDYVATRFDKHWVPDGESLGQEIARKYPLVGMFLPGVNGDPCPPRSVDPECESKPQPAFLDDPFPDEDLLE